MELFLLRGKKRRVFSFFLPKTLFQLGRVLPVVVHVGVVDGAVGVGWSAGGVVVGGVV